MGSAGQSTVLQVGDSVALLAVEGAPVFELRAADITAESPWLDVAKSGALSPKRMLGFSGDPESKPPAQRSASCTTVDATLCDYASQLSVEPHTVVAGGKCRIQPVAM